MFVFQYGSLQSRCCPAHSNAHYSTSNEKVQTSDLVQVYSFGVGVQMDPDTNT